MADLWMGIDLGTRGARAMLAIDDGTVVGEGVGSFSSHRDQERHEQDPEEWWRAVSSACREATGNTYGAEIGALAVCSTSGTVCIVNATGRPITPGIMYDDNRAAAQAERAAEVLQKKLGYRVQPGWAVASLLWLLEHDRVPLGSKVCHQADFVVSRLVGHVPPTDSSHALKTAYDLEAGDWPPELFDELSVPHEVLPEVVPPGSLVGVVSEAAEAATGIPTGTPVVAGMTDGCAGQLAAGAVELGSVNSVLGTTLVVKGVTADRFLDPLGVVYSHRSPDGHWLPGGASNTGAGVLTDTFKNQNLDDLIAEAAIHRPSKVVAYPLAHTGERFPFVAPDAKGLLLGDPSDPIEHCAALTQGVAFAERLAVDHMTLHGADLPGPYCTTGGGTKSRHWCQVRADVLGRHLRLPSESGSAFGMAVLAATTSERTTLAGAVKAMVHPSDEFEPAADSESAYRNNYLRLVGAIAERRWITRELADFAANREWAP